MQKRKTILTLIIVSILLLSGCSKSKPIGEELKEVTPGIYIATIEPSEEGTTFIPQLLLNEDKTFEFKPSNRVVYNGNYHVDNNMLILTLSESKNFTFSSINGKLTLNEEIPETLPKTTHFTLWGSFKEEKIEKEIPQTEISTEETIVEEESSTEK